ncbi:citrate/2-methylcitrate synthase [Acetivibrio mesophilus]|uniref:Citrate synthase n=1 Tax=Acetivibrio mesophilus TaxID=2487273 RepID=A0A4Q0I424_9FIRM|nr:citrate/2-methylcitrate synthase [Acetivibrio mesophilus]ODM27806.1 citrate synthase [Clostridium sp. Bc-iso-3]RXE59008.1 citrate/2-methylcitrate synthase [Acetivibrio mesophilus]HHV29372.1 citrate/2-methylcitrate synthase [Clostridium sp.]
MKNTEFKEFESKKLEELCGLATKSSYIDPELFVKYQVKRGLRDLDGKGVLVGLTEIGEVHSYIIDENEIVPVPGRLIYRGIDIFDLVDGFISEGRFGFEEATYLLLFGNLPNKEQLSEFEKFLSFYRQLPEEFLKDMILNLPGKNIMNVLARSVLAYYSYDSNAEDTSVKNVLNQCIRLIACMPTIAVYAYQALSHYYDKKSLVIHTPRPELSTAENILHMLRPDSKYTKLEASLLDLSLVLHAEHGGGNNSSFVTHVVTSSGTDTYSVIAAAIGSLKGPRHGGANIKVCEMFEDLKQNVKDVKDDDEVENYLMKLLNKEAFDRSGLIYGIGHAVYSISDPRCILLKEQAEKLAKEKGLEDEFELYDRVERLAPQVITRVRKIYKGVSANVDFYSGFVYKMLDLPLELYTPIFAISRMAGWAAHRIEEIVNAGKIIRPAYKSVAQRRDYVSMKDRK